MRPHRLVALTLVLLLPGLPALAAPDCETARFGEGVTLAATTPVAELLATAGDRVGERVAVRGEVTEVCQMAGCWLELRAAEGDAAVRVKVDDGVIVFPKWARGKAATAEGLVERLELSREDYILQQAHDAHESGRDFDETTVVGEGPFEVFRIHGTGAEICK